MDVIIVGAGICGLCIAWELTRRGHLVTVLEQAAEIPNPYAASGDQHRIICQGYYGSADGYVTLLTEAYEAWDRLWEDLRERCYVETGVLSLCQRPGDEADDIRSCYDRMRLSYERLTPVEAASRFPFLNADGFSYATLTSEGGALLCQRITAKLLDFLRARGTAIHAGARVTALDAEAGTVTTATGEISSADCIVAATGAWTSKLLPELATVLTAKRTHIAYVEPPADLYAAWAAAPIILSVGGDNEAWSIPPVAGTGLKFGSGLMCHDAGPDEGEAHTPEIGTRLVGAMGPAVTRLGEYRVRNVRRCAYIVTKDERFLSRRHKRLMVVSACSGHGYKFGAAVGRRVAEAVVTGDDVGLQQWLQAKGLHTAASIGVCRNPLKPPSSNGTIGWDR